MTHPYKKLCSIDPIHPKGWVPNPNFCSTLITTQKPLDLEVINFAE